MRTGFAIMLFIVIGSSVSSQVNSPVENEISRLNSRISDLEKKTEILRIENEKFRDDVDALKSRFSQLNNNLENYEIKTLSEIRSLRTSLSTSSGDYEKAAGELAARVENVEQTTDDRIGKLENKALTYTIYWVVILALVVALAVRILHITKKQNLKQKAELENKLQETQKTLEAHMTLLSNQFNKLNESVEALGVKVNKLLNEKQPG